MDTRTLKALEFDKILEHLATFCVSEAGRQSCKALAPLADCDAVCAEQTLSDQARLWVARRMNAFADFPDLRVILAQLDSSAPSAISVTSGLSEYSVPSGQADNSAFSVQVRNPVSELDVDALWAVRIVLAQEREQVLYITENAGLWPNLFELVQAYPLPEMSYSALSRCLADDGTIRDESSPELSRIRGEMRGLHQNSLHKVREFTAQYNIGQYLQDDYITLASDRYVLPLKTNFKGRIQGIIHDYSNTGETCYFEPLFLIEQNNRLQELKREEREEERRILRQLTELVRNELPFVAAAWHLLVRLDVLGAKARLADAFGGLYVTLDAQRGAPLSVLGARHPLLALDSQMRLQGGPHPLDLVLRPNDRVLVISGGNAGGKTVCLKTLGLVVAMTLSGLPAPVLGGSVMPWWPRVLAFIGDEQSLDDHVSTFTAQIRYLSGSWDILDESSLVLLDEFGAGTDPSQGAALAQAVLDELAGRGAHVVAATHFPALKTYALSREHVRAASVLFDPNTKRPLYRLAYDQVGASQALDVAREHGLPEAVLRRAEQYLLLDGQDSGAIMERLNKLAADREREIALLQAEETKAREKRELYRERFEKERERLQKDVRTSVSEILAAWKENKISAKQALRGLSKAKADLSAPSANDTGGTAATAAAFNVADLKTGQRVLHRPWGKEAVICEVDVRQNRAKLEMNGVTMWADLAVLDTPNSPESPAPKHSAAILVRSTSEENSLLCLDLRGKRADLAISELSRYLDRALLSGMESVEIIHGRGTGVLRKEVHAFLRTFPGLASFVLAAEDRGGDGVTVATFR